MIRTKSLLRIISNLLIVYVPIITWTAKDCLRSVVSTSYNITFEFLEIGNYITLHEVNKINSSLLIQINSRKNDFFFTRKQVKLYLTFKLKMQFHQALMNNTIPFQYVNITKYN